MARDLAEPGNRPAGGWWEWHAGKAALEYLWRGGQLAVARREGFQKVYDLPERVIPAAFRGPAPSHDAFVDWACRSALERLGFATPGELARFWGLLTPAEATGWALANLGAAALPARLEGAGTGARQLLARPDLEELLADLPSPPARLRALNPFDPLLRDRDRLARLFGFDYRIEVFVPAPKRRFGLLRLPAARGRAPDRPPRHESRARREHARRHRPLARARHPPDPRPPAPARGRAGPGPALRRAGRRPLRRRLPEAGRS